ncbi:MAG: Octanoyltransferase [Chitinophagaceae bacterium]|nr:Octanoyltransferase [Chitinophagaceae bacterium]
MNTNKNTLTQWIDLGTIDYKEAWDYQASLFDQIVQIKLQNRNLPEDQQQLTPNYLITCQHPHVFTLGKSGSREHLLVSNEELEKKNIGYYENNRGGDITYHGPGQLVVYPVLDLENFFTDIHRYMRMLEESVILTLRDYGVEAGRSQGQTGVWFDGENLVKARKIAAMGVKTSRWVSMHGLAFNIDVSLDHFKMIVPCGIADKAVTSMHLETTQHLAFDDVKVKLVGHLSSLFGMTLNKK